LRQRIGSSAVPLDNLLRELARVAPERKYLRWINATHGQDVSLITVDEVLYFQADTKYTLVVTAEGESLIRRPLKELQDELDPAQFWPIHRSTIVNANAVAGVTRDFRGRIFVKLKSRNDRLPVSEAHAHLFRQM
jgi:DNA-binding LytR/AlgR family response regulator